MLDKTQYLNHFYLISLVGLLMALAFNVMNAYIFQIGIFPFFMIAALVLFADPSWPRSPQVIEARRQSLHSFRHALRQVGLGATALLIVLHLYALAQVTIPLRHWLYPSDVNWSEEGHRFAWRMKLRDKQTMFKMFVTDPQTSERQAIDPEDWLTRRQASKMASRPDMILQFAHHVADRREQATGVRPIVTVDARAALNGRPYRHLIDPDVDLATQPMTIRPAAWIMPLHN